MIAVSLLPLITGNAGVSALVGTSVQPIPAPEDLASYPCITYQTVSYVPDYTSDGATGFVQARLVFNCWGVGYLQAGQIRDALIKALGGYMGKLPDGTQVFLIRVANGEDYFDPDNRLYRATLHVIVQYAEQ
jgi:hypothetical protein